MANESVARIISDIKSLKIQGANDVAEAGLRCLSLTAKKSRSSNKADLIGELDMTARKVLSTRPTEPELKKVISSVMVQAEVAEIKSVERLKGFVERVCNEQLRKLNEIVRKVAETGAKEIVDGDVILTHCHSKNVVAALSEAKRQDRKFEVIVTETRPLYQGKITAKELLNQKIPVTYSIDSASGHLMKRATKVLVGCDAILQDGSVINKIGTLPIAIVAHRFGKPFIVAGESLKVTRDIPNIEQRNPKELINPGKLRGAKIVNPAFDITPAEYVTKIITEKGVFRPAEIEKLVAYKQQKSFIQSRY